MKAFIYNHDMIQVSVKGDTEIGTLPKRVGIERLRWDGAQVVDLATLSEMWVEDLAGMFHLHAIEVPNSQLVLMKYSDRKNLYILDGVFYVKTPKEKEAEHEAEARQIIKNKLRRRIEKTINDLHDQIADNQKFIYVLILYLHAQRTNDTETAEKIETFFAGLIPDIQGTYDIDQYKDALIERVALLKAEMDWYNDQLNNL